jgi:dUTP pyrophosphatase
MKLKILKNEAVIDNPARLGDAGFDIYAKSDPKVVGSIYQGLYYTAISHIEYNTELRVEPELINNKFNFFLLLYPRSSIIKTNLSLANSVGVIDSGYRGDIKVCFKYVMQPEDMKIVEGKSMYGKNAKGIVGSINPQRIYQKGDKIAQLIPCNHNEMLLEYSESLNESDRQEGGFGSTGS